MSGILERGSDPVFHRGNRQIWRSRLDQTIRQALTRWRIDPANLVVELTESTVMDNAEVARRTLDELKKLGTFLGSAGTMIVAEGTDIVELAAVIAKFYAHESCGQCTPCREGTDWIYQLVLKIHAGEGTKADIDRILDICNNMKGQTICVLSDALADPMKSIVTKFRHEFEARVVDAA